MRSPHLAVSIAAALLLGAVFAGESVWTWIAVLVVAGAWGAVALAGRAPVPAAGYLPLVLLVATAVWSGASIAWSVAPDLSWHELDRTLVYVAFLAVGVLLGSSVPDAARWAAVAVGSAFAAAVLWALAGKAIPALHPDGGRAARLHDPIGYWNALALAADVVLVLALAAAASMRALAMRAGAAVLAYAAVVAILLAASRAGVLAAVLGVGLWLWFRRDRVEAALLALVAAVPAIGVAAWAFTRPALVEDGRPHADRVSDGAWFGLLLLVGGAAVALAVRELDRRPLTPSVRRLAARLLRGAALAALLAATVGGVANAGRIAEEFRGEEVGNDPGRFRNLSSNNRLAWWEEAGEIFAADPLLGAGANTFEVARKRYRVNASSVTQPHSVPLQFLAGTGIVGLALFLALVAAAAVAATAAVRRSTGPGRDAAAALAVALALWLLHALVDYDWDLVAVTGPILFAAGVLAAGRPGRRVTSPVLATAVAVACVASAYSVVTPWLANSSVRDVDRAIERGDLREAESAAERARSLDPFSLRPLFAQARVEEAAENDEAALAVYREATRVQPENPVSWLELGLYEFHLGDRCSAYVHLNRSYTLDPAGKHWTPDSELVKSLAWVNQPGNC